MPARQRAGLQSLLSLETPDSVLQLSGEPQTPDVMGVRGGGDGPGA